MIVVTYGSGEGRTVLEELGKQKCPLCGETADFTAVLDYRYFHVWYIFSFVRGRTYSTRCGNCGGLKELDAKTARQQYPKDGISFITKNGWAVCVALVLAFFLVFAAIPGMDSWSQDSRFASPQVGDVYLADLLIIPNSGFSRNTFDGGYAFGTLKIVEVQGDKLVFAASKHAYPDAKQLSSALDSGEFAQYLDGPRVILDKKQLDFYRRAKSITRVLR